MDVNREPPRTGALAGRHKNWQPFLQRAIGRPVTAGLLAFAALGLVAAPSIALGGEMTSASSDAAGAAPALVGSVHGNQAPLSAASVYAYRLADLSLRKVLTDRQGQFSFTALPAGLYKIIAHKPGFIPAVVPIIRATASSYQQLELDLASASASEDQAADFWTIRQRIPADVLREIVYADALETASVAAAQSGLEQKMRAELRAVQGRDSLVSGADSQVLDGTFDLRAELGATKLDLRSRFVRLSPVSPSALVNVEGESNALALSVFAGGSSRIDLTSQQSELLLGRRPIDFERYGLSWSGDLGRGRSRVEAQYVEESNFYSDRSFEGLHLPDGSRTWQVSGTYQRPLTSSSALRTGVTYRERTSETETAFVDEPLPGFEQERIDLYGLSDVELSSRLDLEAGVFGTWIGGDVVMAPHVGLSYDISDNWATKFAVRERLDTPRTRTPFDLIPLYYRRSLDCTTAESGCYRWSLTHQHGDDSVAVGFVHREYDDTLRVYFSDDFFDQLQSLFLVAGDQLPELQLAVQKRLSPRILTRFESSVGRGGGGTVELLPISLDAAASAENNVDFLVTSLKTRFEATDTGVELAYHSLGQTLELQPLGNATGSGSDVVSTTSLDLDRLRLFITQDLRRVLGLSSDWALLLDMQLSRGGELDRVSDNALRRRIVGGVAVRF